MPREVEVAAVVHALDLLEAERAAEVELDVERGARVVRELLLRVLVEQQPLRVEAERLVPLHALLLPVLEPVHVRARLDEELHLHLLELARAEDEVPGRDLVAERLADLRDAERHLLARRLLDVEEVHVDALRRLRAQVDDRRAVLDRPHERLEHEVELPRLGQRALHAARGTLRVGRARRALDLRIVGAKALLAVAAVDERIGEAGDVAARLPHPRMHQDRRVEPLDVVARADHRVPPAILEFFLSSTPSGP